MDLLLKKMHSPDEYTNRQRPWIVRNKLIGLMEMADRKKYPCVSVFSTSMEDVPKHCWKLLRVKGHKDVMLCSKTLTFVSAAKAEFHFDKTNTVITHIFVDCIRDNMKNNDKSVFWKHQMELYFQLINSHYENVKEIDADTLEQITKELQHTNITENLKQDAAKENPEEAPKGAPEEAPEEAPEGAAKENPN